MTTFCNFGNRIHKLYILRGVRSRPPPGPGRGVNLGVFPPISGPSREGAEIVNHVMGRWNEDRFQYDPPDQGVETEKIGHFWPILGGTPPDPPGSYTP